MDKTYSSGRIYFIKNSPSRFLRGIDAQDLEAETLVRGQAIDNGGNLRMLLAKLFDWDGLSILQNLPDVFLLLFGHNCVILCEGKTTIVWTLPRRIITYYKPKSQVCLKYRKSPVANHCWSTTGRDAHENISVLVWSTLRAAYEISREAHPLPHMMKEVEQGPPRRRPR